jgi:vitamin B12/bleomycin/antimicrobial peptide transport system ATP-binding/permease protein
MRLAWTKMKSGRSFLARVWALTAPYWRSEERWRARGLLAAVVALTLGGVGLLVLLNNWNREFYNSLEQRDAGAFGQLLLQFCVLAAVYIVGSVYQLFLTQQLEFRWRSWLTQRYLSAWLSGQAYYQMELQPAAASKPDNPDQRIAEDLRYFTQGTLSLSLGLLSSVVTLVSFIVILWSVSGPLAFAVGGREVSIPGYMVWVAIAYALVGSLLTHLIGRPLIGLNVRQERTEADFRFNLVRVRENAEGVALSRGEAAEQAGLLRRFDAIRANWWALMYATRRLTAFTVGYAQIAVVFPILVAAPRYFAGAISLGVLMQISQAFGQVQDSLSWFVNSYGTLANWKASVDRLLTFENALAHTAPAQAAPTQSVPAGAALAGAGLLTSGGSGLHAAGLDLAVPTGQVVLSGASFDVAPGDRVLLKGPSGSGKTTLFRAIAGIWPFGKGSISLPEGAHVLFLPQKPYFPLGSLREAVSYPSAAGAFDDAAIREALAAVQLDSLAGRLDEVQSWNLQLSGGEQQRLALARALLQRPDWLFLDEATSALDEASEAHVYEQIGQRLPGATVISIAHRPGVAAYHGRTLELVPDDASGCWTLRAPAAGPVAPPVPASGGVAVAA